MMRVKAHLEEWPRGGGQGVVLHCRTPPWDPASSHQTPLTQRVERARGMISEPCCMKPPTGNQRLLPSVYWFSRRFRRSRRQG